MARAMLVVPVLVSMVGFAWGESYRAQVVAVKDGATLIVMRGKRPVRIRLLGVESPKVGRPSGEKAKQFLAELVLGRNATITTASRGHAVVRIYWRSVVGCGRMVDVASRMVATGMARWNRHERPVDRRMRNAEALARQARIGLWAKGR